ncbi:DedA family protein [Pelagibacterales bacterium SAG-MED31]|nr:DedA family protein [Pelagibacterales bacterium SAG-MED31]
MKLLRFIYNWTLNKAKHKYSSWILSIVAFAESSFFPIPPDILLIPMIIAKRVKAWTYAFICTFSSVLGGVIGYGIGYFFYNSIGVLIIDTYNLSNSFDTFGNYYNEYGILIVLGAGFTPFPFKFITIASGVFNLNIILFIITAIIARGLRFYLLAGLLFVFGEKIKVLIDKYFNILVILFFILLIGSVLLIKFI